MHVLTSHFVPTNSNISTSNNNQFNMDFKIWFFADVNNIRTRKKLLRQERRSKKRRPGEEFGNHSPGGGVGL